MVFTSVLLVIFNSIYSLFFIIIFYVYDSKIHFIYVIPFIFRFLALIVTSSHPVTASLFFSQHNGVISQSPLLIFCISFLTHFPWVWLIIRIAAYVRTTFLSHHIVAIYPPRKPDSGLVLCSEDDAVDGDWYRSDTAPISPILPAGGPPVKNRPGSLYDGAALIAPEDGNTLQASVRSQRWCPVRLGMGVVQAPDWTIYLVDINSTRYWGWI